MSSITLVGLLSYSLCAIGFALLSGLLLIGWRGRTQGALLVLASLATMVWAGLLAFSSMRQTTPVLVVEVAEIVRDGAWLIFIGRLLSTLRASKSIRLLQLSAYGVPLLMSGIILILLLHGQAGLPLDAGLHSAFVMGAMTMALLALVLLEQFYRNLRLDRRWAVKYLCIGVGTLFCFDLILYSQMLLFRHLEPGLWDARGAVDVMAVPLIAVAAARNPNWSLDIFMSRRAALQTSSIMAVGLYLLAISAGGYYVRDFGGTWGRFAEIVFVSAMFVGLIVVVFSGKARAKARVFISKNFFNYRYDYREEWLRLIACLTDDGDQPDPYLRAIRAVAQIVETPGGALWLRRNEKEFLCSAQWNFHAASDRVVAVDENLAQFLSKTHWIVDLRQYRTHPLRYQGLELPPWLESLDEVWLLVPLFHGSDCSGFMLLANSHAPRALTWEDRDLLKTLGLQIGSFLAQHESAQALSQSRQFEAFNRMSAFLMHDLKNLIAQQSLVVKNASRHKDNPAFIDDAIQTIDQSVKRMQRLLEQLRRGQIGGSTECVEAGSLVQQVVASCRNRPPVPVFRNGASSTYVDVERERFCAILAHVIHNAQDATTFDGHVVVTTQVIGHQLVVEVNDDGEGMNDEFIREKLFRPFFTTKASRGMGIGAFQAREFAQAAGGSVEVTSALEHGTSFRVILPLARLASSAPETGIINPGPGTDLGR